MGTARALAGRGRATPLPCPAEFMGASRFRQNRELIKERINCAKNAVLPSFSKKDTSRNRHMYRVFTEMFPAHDEKIITIKIIIVIIINLQNCMHH